MKLYTYDHCPYCVRVRYAFGVKDLAFEHEILLNDDEETPIRLIGAKMVPILERDDGTSMGESFDIVRTIDAEHGERVFPESGDGAALAEWAEATGETIRRLLFPRWAQAPLKEFATESARAYFTRKKTESIGDFQEALDDTPALKASMDAALVDLEPLIRSPEGVHGSLTIDDVDVFGRLRGLTLVKDLRFPPGVRAYIDHMSELGKVPLYDDMATI